MGVRDGRAVVTGVVLESTKRFLEERARLEGTSLSAVASMILEEAVSGAPGAETPHGYRRLRRRGSATVTIPPEVLEASGLGGEEIVRLSAVPGGVIVQAPRGKKS